MTTFLDTLEASAKKATPNHREHLLSLVVDRAKLLHVAKHYGVPVESIIAWITRHNEPPPSVVKHIECEWRPCIDFPAYEVSEYGYVRRATDAKTTAYRAGRPRKGSVDRYGYLIFRLYENAGQATSKHAGVLVLESFCGPRPTPEHQAAHNDGDKANNHISNLRWATPKENSHDKVRHGTSLHGADHGSAKLTHEQAAAALKDRRSSWVVAAEYGVSASAIQSLRNGRSWQRTFPK